MDPDVFFFCAAQGTGQVLMYLDPVLKFRQPVRTVPVSRGKLLVPVNLCEQGLGIC